MPSPRLILFDIDGTILLTRGAGRIMLSEAFQSVTGREVTIDGVAFAGRTDQSIAYDVAARNGIDGSAAADVVPRALSVYESRWRQDWATIGVERLPGVEDLILRLAEQPHVHLALVTGNIRDVAYHKLKCVALDQFFLDGAFGCDSADRNQLPEIAVTRMQEHNSVSYHASDIIVVGDTPRDVECARTVGASVVAVCTGHYSREDLEEAGADIVLDSLHAHTNVYDYLANGVAA